jgi:hypothetical protein
MTDGAVVFDLARLTARLEADLAAVDVVVTHSYEGGHPDHDACALAVALACGALARSGRAPLHLEFASYHARNGGKRHGRLWRLARAPTRRVPLRGAALATKTHALAAFASQAEIIAEFPLHIEEYRVAPAYDFSRPPPPGRFMYDWLDLGVSGEVWLRLVEPATGRPARRPSLWRRGLGRVRERLLRPWRVAADARLERRLSMPPESSTS